MKDELYGKYMPPYFYDHLLDKWRRITQDNKDVEEYVTEFDEFLTRYNILGLEGDVQVFFQFRARLRVALKMSYEIMKSLSSKKLMPWSKI